MAKLYGSLLCPDCVEAIEYLDKIDYKYDFINITESMINLKEFLKHRDTREEFKEFLGQGYIIIPALLTDDDKFIIVDDIFNLK